MATILDIFVTQTYNVNTLAVADISTYDGAPVSPSLGVGVPGFPVVEIPFVINTTNIINSFKLGLSEVGADYPLPDGIYHLTYSIAPAYENFVTKTFMRVDKIQEKFDSAFMQLDMMECNMAVKTQAKVELSSIYFLIQGSISAANNCAELESEKLYQQANKMLDRFIKKGCGC